MLGPAIAGGLLLVTTAPVVLVLNAVSFAMSAVLLSGVDLGPAARSAADVPDDAAGHDSPPGSVWADTRAGRLCVVLWAALSCSPVRCSTCRAAARHRPAPHALGYSVLMALYGLGIVAGSDQRARRL